MLFWFAFMVLVCGFATRKLFSPTIIFHLMVNSQGTYNNTVILLSVRHSNPLCRILGSHITRESPGESLFLSVSQP